MSILVILLHHAKTVDNSVANALSESGKKMQSRVNAFIKELEVTPTQIWTSSLLAASETARMIAREYNQEPIELEVLGELEMFDEAMINEQVKELPDESTVLIVSRALPLMRLASYWLGYPYYAGAPPASSALFLVFKNKVGSKEAKLVRFVTYEDLVFGEKIK